MKKTFIIIISLMFVTGTFSQSLQEAKELLYHERYNSETKMLHAILKNDVNNEEAWYLLTTSYIEQNKIKEIKDSLQQAPQDLRDKPLMQVAAGDILLSQNDVENAKQHYDQAIKETRQKDPYVLMEIARAFIDTKNADANYALELLGKAEKRDKKNPELYVLMGDAYSKLSNGSDAYSSYKKALEINPDYARAAYRLGKIFTAQKNPIYMRNFENALRADSLYAPALYEIYYHYYFRDVAKAMEYLKKYIKASDPDVENDYRLTDILYLNKDYEAAISYGAKIIKKEGKSVSPRIYKLIANSYYRLNDNENAIEFMQKYFTKNTDTTFLASDYETMGEIYESSDGKEDSAAHYFILAAERNVKDTGQFRLYKKIAALYSKTKEYGQQALWLQKYYTANAAATNLDLFNTGTAFYYAGDYHMSDSVFGIYTEKYPDQKYGYYWRAKSNVAIDTAMELGLAIPYYLKVIEIAEKDTTDDVNRKRLIESYGYIASFKANHDKDYPASIEYFEKILMLQPNNVDAQKYVAILQKYVKDETTGGN